MLLENEDSDRLPFARDDSHGSAKAARIVVRCGIGFVG